MLRTINLHLFHIGIPRFNTIGHPKALEACYEAHWRLLRPDFHWQAVDSLQNTRLSPIRNVRRKAHDKNGVRMYILAPFHLFIQFLFPRHKIQLGNSIPYQCSLIFLLVKFFIGKIIIMVP